MGFPLPVWLISSLVVLSSLLIVQKHMQYIVCLDLFAVFYIYIYKSSCHQFVKISNCIFTFRCGVILSYINIQQF